MPSDAPAPYDVAVVGLGPVGATLAALLGRRGLRVVALDRDTAPHSLPRAAHLDGHALRVLAEAGAPAMTTLMIGSHIAIFAGNAPCGGQQEVSTTV